MKQNTLVSRQLAFLLFLCMLGTAFIFVPVNAAGRSSWLSSMAGSLIFFFILYLMIAMQKMYPGVSILEISKQSLGVYATLFITWFMSCFTAQQVFGLREYRFLAAPISLIIGVLSIIMSNNIIEFRVVTLLLINWVYFAAFIIIPFIVLLIALIKPAANSSPLNTGQESEFQL
jgi:hypothetical protein